MLQLTLSRMQRRQAWEAGGCLPGTSLTPRRYVGSLSAFSGQTCRIGCGPRRKPQACRRFICALEALAQLILLVLQRQDGIVTNAGRVVVRQRCDNLGVVGTSATGFSMKEPVAGVLQAAAVYCMRERINLRVSHVAGARNTWADMLSRGPDVYPEFWRELSLDSRRSVDWQQLLSAGRPEHLGRASKIEPPR